MFNKVSRWFLCIVMFENYCLKLPSSKSGRGICCGRYFPPICYHDNIYNHSNEYLGGYLCHLYIPETVIHMNSSNLTTLEVDTVTPIL